HMHEPLMTKPHHAAAGTVEPADDVEQRAFAGTVGTNDGPDLTLGNRKINAVERSDPAKAEADALKAQNRLGAASHRGRRGRGRRRLRLPRGLASALMRARQDQGVAARCRNQAHATPRYSAA